tara:strand:+ start:724 stop:912 length:189 start_codon:yes stop_codon:yes gene_type:complete
MNKVEKKAYQKVYMKEYYKNNKKKMKDNSSKRYWEIVKGTTPRNINNVSYTIIEGPIIVSFA